LLTNNKIIDKNEGTVDMLTAFD